MCKSKAPDMSGVNAAAQASAEVAKQALEWYQSEYAAQKPLRDAQANTAQQVSEAQLASLQQNDALAKDYADYNKTTFRPLEQGIVADAATYDTPEKRQAAADAAMADVNSSFAATGSARARALAASGVNPGSARAMSAMQGQDVDQAKALAGAAYSARKGVEMTGHALKMDAASLGRNLPSAQAVATQNANNAGNSAVSSAGAPVVVGNQSINAGGSGFNTAIQGNQVAGNLYNTAAATTANADNGLWGALGAVGGAAISKYSDKNLKTEITPEDPETALEEVRGTPASTFKYDPAALASRGIEMTSDMQGEQSGPMAQDVQQSMGEKASNGKKVNVKTIMGKTIAAVQALDEKVNRIAAMIQSGQVGVGAPS